MPDRPTALTGAAGEHYVAYYISALGYPVALTRGGSPTIDLMVGSMDGNKTLSIQVKTSNWAFREYKRKIDNNHWEWDVGKKALSLRGESIFYAFVDLKWWPEHQSTPDVFIVSANTVADYLGEDWSRYMFHIWKGEEGDSMNRWDIIENYLENPSKNS